MATQSSDTHHRAQLALVALIAALVRHIFATLFDPRDPKASEPKLIAALEAVAVHYGNAAASAALIHYRAEHAAAGAPGVPKLTMPAPITHDAVVSIVEEFVANVSTPTSALDASPVVAAEDNLAKELEQMVFDQGQRALGVSIALNKGVKGWARIPEADCCSFCALLAIRGPVYKDYSFTASNARFKGSGHVKVHDSCRCGMEPVFNAFEPSAQVRQWQQEYIDATGDVSGSAEKQKAWRRAHENRADGPTFSGKKRTP